jgi:TetR/AcrR family transcriptional repressor of lmrAB and yxaGH operons
VHTTQSSRARLLAAAEQLLREAGMAGIGMKEIAQRGQAPMGSVYHHFPRGKTQLVSEALEIHARKSRSLLASFFDGKRPAADAVRLLFDTAAKGFERAGANKGCAIGAVTLDVTDADETLRHLCAATFESWAGIIAGHLPWADARARRSFANLIIVALEGAFVLGRARRSGAPFREAGRWLSELAQTQQKPSRRRKKR